MGVERGRTDNEHGLDWLVRVGREKAKDEEGCMRCPDEEVTDEDSRHQTARGTEKNGNRGI